MRTVGTAVGCSGVGSCQIPFIDRVSLQYRPPAWNRDDMAAQSPKVLRLLCTSLLVIAFLAVLPREVGLLRTTQARAVRTLVPASSCFSGTQLERWAW